MAIVEKKMGKVFEENLEIQYLDLHLEQMKSFVMMEDLLTDQKKFDAARLVSLLYDVLDNYKFSLETSNKMIDDKSQELRDRFNNVNNVQMAKKLELINLITKF